MEKKDRVKVVIIEDDETIRESYAYLIGNNDQIKVTGTYGSFEEAEKKLIADAPDVLLLDVELPGINGIEALPQIKKLLPGVFIIILTVYENEEMIFKALSNGAAGYLTKNTPPEKLIFSIHDVLEGGGPMSANVARLVIKSFRRNPQTPLSKRETEILQHVADGKSRSRIADEIFVDVETVKTHLKNIYYKLNVHSKADAISTAKRNKFI
ncbi:MAG: response regulator transcription factor [Pedobacter sp.]|nr:MAG: response regulator transcription factor [Pedobacter sp.]